MTRFGVTGLCRAYDAAMPEARPAQTTDIPSWDLDGAISIAWHADGYESIRVHARWRRRDELEAFARGVADVALMERTLSDLRNGLRRAFPGAFDLDLARDARGGPAVVVRFHPPKGEPNPDPYE